jgi:hypothetical protein
VQLSGRGFAGDFEQGVGEMKHYLSFGAGVNSVALYLLMEDLGMEFEAVFVDHGGDWPETYDYFKYFVETGRPVTVLKPDVEGFSDIYEYYMFKKKVPSLMKRDCTDKFKLRPFYKYVEKPSFIHLGIDAGESHRARLNSKKGIENRYLLIEEAIDREGCKELIAAHGLVVPPKSGCYFCMFQKKSQWRHMRRFRPELFCKAETLERETMNERERFGTKVFTLLGNGKTLGDLINEGQAALPGMEDLEYPPCQCER